LEAVVKVFKIIKEPICLKTHTPRRHPGLAMAKVTPDLAHLIERGFAGLREGLRMTRAVIDEIPARLRISVSGSG
jgi:hypothetical protein